MIIYFSICIEAKPLAKIIDQVVQNFIWIDIICRYEPLVMIIIDNRSQFDDKWLMEFYESQKV